MEKLHKYGKLIATDNQNFEGIELYSLTAARTKKIYFFIEENTESEEKEESLKLTFIVSGKNKESNTEPVRHSFIIKRLKFIDYVLLYITQNIVNFEEFEESNLFKFLNKIDRNLATIQKRKGNGRGYDLNKNFNLVAR